MKITNERILKITNDINEDIKNPTSIPELRECVRYWALEASKAKADSACKGAVVEILQSCLKMGISPAQYGVLFSSPSEQP